MTTPTLTPEIKPEVSFIQEVLRELADGRIRIPGFLRPYVWRRSQMIDLLGSIQLHYPIGSLLLWEPSERYRTLDWVGPFRIPAEPKSSIALVLDGQQRLATLAGVLLPPAGNGVNPRDDDPGRWEIWFNARDNVFEHPSEYATPQPWHFPMRKLMDTIEFLKECQRIKSEAGEDGDRWVVLIQRLARIFQLYKLPVIRIRNTNLDQAVEIFARLNSSGQRVSADQLVSALVYPEPGDEVLDLSQHVDDLHGFLLKSDFGDVDRTTVLRVLLACLDEDVYRTDWTRVASERRPDVAARLSEGGPRIREALARAVDFLRSCGVYHERLLPYAMQLVVLTGFFYHCSKPTVAQLRFARRWFWVSSFTGWGGSGNSSRVGGLVKEFSSSVARTEEPKGLENMRLDEPALPFPKSFDMRSARARALLLVLLSQEPASADGSRIQEPWRLISRYGPEAVGYVMYRVKAGELVSSPANRIIKPDIKAEVQAGASHGRWAQAKGWLLGLDPRVRADVLKSHAIPQEAFEALQNNDPAEFFRCRLNYLIELERKFMEREGVTLPGDMGVPQLAPIDTDDVAPPVEPLAGAE